MRKLHILILSALLSSCGTSYTTTAVRPIEAKRDGKDYKVTYKVDGRKRTVTMTEDEYNDLTNNGRTDVFSTTALAETKAQ